MKENIIFAIDLKSFYAFAECIDRSLDPFKVPLAVADISRGNGCMTLAASPYLKSLGVPSRTRVFQIPYNIRKQIIFVPPRLDFYIEKSKEVIKVYESFFSKDDILVYSVDEVFINATPYLNLYKKSPEELALLILQTLTKKTSLVAACGIGPNIFMAKVAMDRDSKHNKNNIAYWKYSDVPSKLWPITPLSDIWMIGSKTQIKLNKLGIIKAGDINKYSKNFYKEKFGIYGEELYDHLNGIDNTTIKDLKKKPKSSSMSISQILYRDYTKEETILIIREMCDTVTRRLRKENKVCKSVYLKINYSKEITQSFKDIVKLTAYTSDTDQIIKQCMYIYNNYIEDYPIRKISIALLNLESDFGTQLDLFNETKEQANNLTNVIDEVKSKFGKNAILSASSLLDYSTIRERNKKQKG